jgi:hypothetical protein
MVFEVKDGSIVLSGDDPIPLPNMLCFYFFENNMLYFYDPSSMQ